MNKIFRRISLGVLQENPESNAVSQISLAPPSTFCIGENKNAKQIRVTFHPDCFLRRNGVMNLFDEPPLDIPGASDEMIPPPHGLPVYPIEMNEYSPDIAFDCTVSPVLCEMGYVRVNARKFESAVQQKDSSDSRECMKFRKVTEREYYYVPMTVMLPDSHQNRGPFTDNLVIENLFYFFIPIHGYHLSFAHCTWYRRPL